MPSLPVSFYPFPHRPITPSSPSLAWFPPTRPFSPPAALGDKFKMRGLKKSQLSFNEEMVKDGDIKDEELDSESEAESEEMAVAEPTKDCVYNRDGLVGKLEDIVWPENVDWIHKLTVDHDQAQKIDVNDDLARELSFYTQALDGTRQAFGKLQSMGIPFLRPPDYYAEMVKTDTHMLKVKGKLLTEKKKIEEAEERKKARDAKKIAKSVQAEKTKERAKRKKEEIESVKKWRKQREQSGYAGRGDDEAAGLGLDGFEGLKKARPGVAPGDRSGGFARRGGKLKGGKDKKNDKKREYRESRFGHGGRKGTKKQNTAETTDDLRGFNKDDRSGNKKRKR